MPEKSVQSREKVRYGVAVFPGSNCDYDTYRVISELDNRVNFVWHEERSLNNYDCIVLPGGFSYGDYLRTGAIARFSPLMQSLPDFLDRGGLVLGICNGFQILLEAGLLPGAMLQNKSLKFICRYVYLRVESNNSPFTRLFKKGQVIRMPIAHHAGNYYADENTIFEIENKKLVLLRYCDKEGSLTEESNPNGSLNNIAGITNLKGNVFGLMPHPERASSSLLGSEDGKLIFKSITSYIAERVRSF